MKEFLISPVGQIRTENGERYIQLEETYVPALQALEGFSHINVLWWCDECDFEEARKLLEVPKPYQKAPDTMGIFATRSPARPNPIALSTVTVLEIDYKKGRIFIPYADANDGSPVIDLKPYTPSIDRIEKPSVPDWCSHWPQSVEASASFDWSKEFAF